MKGLIAACLLCSACSSAVPVSFDVPVQPEPVFLADLPEPQPVLFVDAAARTYEPSPLRVTLMCVNAPVSQVLSAIARAGAFVAVSPDRAIMPVTIQWIDLPVEDALQQLADTFGGAAIVVRRGDRTWWVGDPLAGDLVSAVYRSPTSLPGDVTGAIGTLLSPAGRVSIVDDSVIITDSRASIERAARVLHHLSEPRRQWHVRVMLVELSHGQSHRLGLNWRNFASFAVRSASFGGWDISATTDLIAALEAEASRGDFRIVSNVRLVATEGVPAMIQVGTTTPVPIRTTSPEGTVTTTGYSQVDSGVLLRLTTRALNDGRVSVRFEPEVSSVTGFVESSPILSRRRLETTLTLAHGQQAVLGGLTDDSFSRNVNGGIPYLLDVPVAGGVTVTERDHRRLWMICDVTAVEPVAVLERLE